MFKGKRLKPELYDNLLKDSLLEKSAKGYTTKKLSNTIHELQLFDYLNTTGMLKFFH